MSIAITARKILFLGSLLAITGSFLFDPLFARDSATPVPEPNILSLLAIGGVSGIALSLIRRYRK